MIQDLTLTNSAGAVLGYAKIDITNDTVNVTQKQISVDDISFTPVIGVDDAAKLAFKTLQQKIEAFIQPRNFLFKDLIAKFTSINVTVTFKGSALNATTTTTTAAPTTTTTTTA